MRSVTRKYSAPALPPSTRWLLAAGLGLVWTAAAMGGGIVTEATEPALRAALAGGGTVTLAFSGKVVLSSPLVITNATVIDGTGQGVTISGGGWVRVFEVRPGVSLTLRGITVADGKAQGIAGTPAGTGGPGQGGAGQGGGIFSDGGDVVLADCRFTNNFAVGGKGGSSTSVPAPGGWGMGGAVCALAGTLTATNCRFEWNQATGGEGGDGGSGGNGSEAVGGAIYESATRFELLDCVLTGNHAVGGRDGIGGGLAATAVGSGFGGALCCEGTTSRLAGSRFSGNSASAPRPLFFAGGPGSAAGGAVYQGHGNMEIAGCTFASNRVLRAYTRFDSGRGPVLGGAICNRALSVLHVRLCEFRGNTATAGECTNSRGGNAFGGAVFNEGSAIIQDTLLTGNLAAGGDLDSRTGLVPGWAFGGAILNMNALTVSGSTFNGNRAVGLSIAVGPSDYMGAEPGYGGALGNMGSVWATNNTFAGNSAEGGPGSPLLAFQPGGDAYGGGIYSGGGSMTLVHLTFAGNGALPGSGVTPGTPHGSAMFNTNGVVTLKGVIVADSTAGANVEGPIVDGGNNLSSDATPIFTSGTSRGSLDPGLGPLADNGGPTPTMALLEASPAIDAASGQFSPTIDQRGYVRPVGAASDIGAFEFGGSPFALWLVVSVPEDGSILVHVDGIQGSRHILERSSDFSSWVPVWTNLTLPFDCLETMIGPPGNRWYRARTEP